ncbi:flagellar type III secretion system protein FlhB [Sphingomonas sp.]|uniref:EscU/YscU/HrcU family type III secretion system export apparatus switch protein n=1 Tax=Sphingomonas sp. TaxID=28214 RepID=UPI002B97217C|nr:flagellar type III secretion system protein FlhB [Sphingomonas sp.]HWK36620.1 flagellar type III secretion system protein FlhB [Sphingomonas sp.]
MSDNERTEAPTPKRLQKARDEGDVLRSREFASALVILIGCGWMVFFGPGLLAACRHVMTASFSFGRDDVEHFEPFRPLAEAGWTLAPSMGVLFAVAVAAAILSQAGLGALTFNPKNLGFKPNKLNPAKGLKRIFGANGWIELVKSLLKVVLLGSIGVWMLWRTAHGSMGLVSTDLNRALGTLGDSFLTLLFAMAGGLVVIAGIDVPVQAIRRMKNLKMSHQEIKDEHKESEGSPEVKSAIRARQREILKRNFRKAVAEAHVVLTNPTHFAVALRYDRFNDQVPVVVAKGRGDTALAIRELAAEMAVPVLEYPTLARAVYYTSKEGQEVRDDLYLAIATVLAFVFGLNAEAGGTQPNVAVPETARFDENGRKNPTIH